MTKKDKAIQELCDSLGGDYKVQDIDLETCIYRDFGNGFDVEIRSLYHKPEEESNYLFMVCGRRTLFPDCPNCKWSSKRRNRKGCRGTVCIQ